MPNYYTKTQNNTIATLLEKLPDGMKGKITSRIRSNLFGGNN